MCACVCAYVCMCVFAYVCACVCVCAVQECECVRSCVCACSIASHPYFNAYPHAHAKVGVGREGKKRLSRPSRFLLQPGMRGMSSTCT